MRRVVLITFTPKDWSGGVNRWVRDFISGYDNSIHFCASDIPNWKPGICNEWDAAKALAAYLKSTNNISKNDIIIVDGFWGIGLDDFPNVISVAHGIWSHQTKEDVELGKPPDFPVHHAIQLNYRKNHVSRGGRIVAVSDFISTELRKQWQIPSFVINNAIDINAFVPRTFNNVKKKRKLIIHGVNDIGNENKGWSHILHIKNNINDVDVMSLDEAHLALGMSTKQETLAQADLVVIPSAYEGNSYFCLEALSCDVPIIAYNVGLMYKTWGDKNSLDVGVLLDRKLRCQENTLHGVLQFINDPHTTSPRSWVSKYSIENFHNEWNNYLTKEFS